MRKPNLHVLWLLGCLFVLACGEAALASTAIVPRDDEMVVESRAIITGRVIGLSTAVDSNTDRVYTYIRLEVDTVLKGAITEREIVLKELGGETAELGTMIFGMPRFEQGQRVLLYLNTWPDGALRVHQGFLGKFNINVDASTGRLFVERRLEDQNVVIMAGSSNGTDRSELDTYTQMVADLMATNRKKMRDFEQRYYSGVPILAQPADLQSGQSGKEVTPQWVLLSPSSPARWFEPDSNQPVVFYVNPTGAPSFAQFPADIQAAMDAWSTSGGSVRVIYGGTTTGCGVQLADGINTISFNNCDSYFAASQGCSGLLAVSGIIRYLPSQTKNIGGTTYGKAVEANMSFNPYALCNFTNRCQLQEVATHEMGHALGLGHSTDTTATMLAYAHFDNRCSSVMSDDAQGITAIYPGKSGSGGLSVMTSDLPTASMGLDYAANLVASGGSGVYHWNVASGQVPPGMQLGMSGLLYGKTSVSGDFNFTARVLDSSGNASQQAITLVVRAPGMPPTVTGGDYRKKKVFVSGQGFQTNAIVYVDGQCLSASFDGTTLTTGKAKQKSGVHQVYVVNPDGAQSNTVQLVVE
jgi:Matrixin